MTNQKIKAKNIDTVNLESGFFHFTASDNIGNIQEQGLIPKIGNNAKGAEKTEKIFFAKGASGILEIFNVWIRWIYYLKKQNRYFYNNQNGNFDEFIINFTNEAFSDFETKKEVFEEINTIMQNSVFLDLNLTEGEDFSYDDVDEAKKNKDRRIIKVLYGSNATLKENDYHMENWNLHTKTSHSIIPEKITLLSVYGKNDVLSVIKYLYDSKRNLGINLELLDEFMNYNLNKENKDNFSL